MDALDWSDHRDIAEFVRELYGLGSTEAISGWVVSSLKKLVDGETVLYCCHLDPQGLSRLVDTLGLELHSLTAVHEISLEQDPGIRYQRTLGGQAFALFHLVASHDRGGNRWSDKAARGLVRSGERSLGKSANGRPEPSEHRILIVNRVHGAFTARERSVLEIVRLHLLEAYRAASLRSFLHRPQWAAETLEALGVGSVIILGTGGAPQFCSAAAQKHLEEFFSGERPFEAGLPLAIGEWVRCEEAALTNNPAVLRLPKPLVIRRGERTLHIHIGSAPDGVGHLLFLRAEDPGADLEKLKTLGLGPRATDVLYWVSQGKTNEEVGIILGMATGTVKNHLKGIYSRLNVENRGSAVATVSGILASSK